MTTSELKKEMKKVQRHYNKISTIVNSLPNDVQMAIHEFHVENCGLLHCTRWGLQASEELINFAKEIIKTANE